MAGEYSDFFRIFLSEKRGFGTGRGFFLAGGASFGVAAPFRVYNEAAYPFGREPPSSGGDGRLKSGPGPFRPYFCREPRVLTRRPVFGCIARLRSHFGVNRPVGAPKNGLERLNVR